MPAIFTHRHSTHPFEQFAKLLKLNGVTAIADVRSAPYSRYNPQYNREPLKAALESFGIAYSHLGDQLGAMRTEAEVYLPSGPSSTLRTWLTPAFREGVQRLRTGLQKYSIAMMCAERDPLTCHRNLLISRFLRTSYGPLPHPSRRNTRDTRRARVPAPGRVQAAGTRPVSLARRAGHSRLSEAGWRACLSARG